jgi:DNA-damage-inducible protein J
MEPSPQHGSTANGTSPIAEERRLPFDVKVPNATTRKAIAELEAGKDKKFASVDDLMADLHADD